MDNQTVGGILVVVGVLLPLLAWSFFRKEEHKFFTFAPVTEAHKYMRPPGGTIWWIGIVVLCLGVINCWSAR